MTAAGGPLREAAACLFPIAAICHNQTMAETPQSVRTIKLMRKPGAAGVGVFCIRVGDEAALYPFREVPCHIGGRGFLVMRWGTRRSYYVRIGAAEECSCECLGYLFRRRCRHIQGLTSLLRRGKM